MPHRLLLVLPLLLLLAPAWCGEAKGAITPGSAHEPRYDDPALWPPALETAKAAYAKEVWPKGRTLTWNGKGWDEDGKPAAQGPDEQADIVIPPGTTANLKERLRVRHVTVEAGGNVSFSDIEMDGNLWIKKGGKWARNKGTFGAADRHTFARNDNPGFQFIMNMVRIDKKPGVSLEWLGKWKTGDELNVSTGTMILGPGSVFGHTDRREMHVYSKAALVLLSGATWESRGNLYKGPDLVIDGQLLAGTRERPLTADCTLGLSFKAKGAAKGSMATKGAGPKDVGLVLMPEALLEVASSDPKKARLCFRWHRHPQETHAFKDGEPEDLKAMPHGIEIRLFGDAKLDGVLFDDILKGGIQLTDPARRSAWKNLEFGKGCFAAGDELFAAWTGEIPKVLKETGGRK